MMKKVPGHLECAPSNSRLKIKKGSAIYGIKLVDDDAPLKSKIRIQVPQVLKILKNMIVK